MKFKTKRSVRRRATSYGVINYWLVNGVLFPDSSEQFLLENSFILPNRGRFPRSSSNFQVTKTSASLNATSLTRWHHHHGDLCILLTRLSPTIQHIQLLRGNNIVCRMHTGWPLKKQKTQEKENGHSSFLSLYQYSKYIDSLQYLTNKTPAKLQKLLVNLLPAFAIAHFQ